MIDVSCFLFPTLRARAKLTPFLKPLLINFHLIWFDCSTVSDPPRQGRMMNISETEHNNWNTGWSNVENKNRRCRADKQSRLRKAKTKCRPLPHGFGASFYPITGVYPGPSIAICIHFQAGSTTRGLQRRGNYVLTFIRTPLELWTTTYDREERRGGTRNCISGATAMSTLKFMATYL